MEAENIANCNPFFKNYFSIWYNNIFIWQCVLVLNQSDVDLIKRSKYITDRILGFIFEVGISFLSPKEKKLMEFSIKGPDPAPFVEKQQKQ